jgi:hypothetical protein
MIDAMTPSSATAPTVDSPGVVQAPGFDPMTTEPPAPAAPSRRPSKLMAELSRAMQAAAEHSRDETMTRFDADAKTVVEEINAASTVEAANLRRRADDDVAAVREWSKAEIARVRDLTEERIGQRKSALDGEMEEHASVIQARIDRVGARVATYHTEMDEFFGRLLAEEDPTRIATMAEMMPEPPSLAEVAAAVASVEPSPFAPPSFEPAPFPAGVRAEPAATSPGASSQAFGAPAKIDFAAAEAEAAAMSADIAGGPAESAAHDAMNGSGPKATTPSQPAAGHTSTRVVVLGLVSVASIATFKRELNKTAGVVGIGVSSGPDGEFVFSVTHQAGIDIAAAVTNLPGFQSRITAQADDTLEVSATDPEAAD